MLNTVFESIFTTMGTDLFLGSFCMVMLAALVLGGVLAALWGRNASRSFCLTLGLLPAVVSIVILMVSGSLGAGIAVAGTFSLVRFRSQPGTAREICAIFLAMAVGLACGMGYLGFAAVFTAIMCLAGLVYDKLLSGKEGGTLSRRLRITVPEELDYSGAFEDLFSQYTCGAKLVAVKTTNLGSLNRLSYDIQLKSEADMKPLIDALRCRNGNLEISCSLLPTDGGEL